MELLQNFVSGARRDAELCRLCYKQNFVQTFKGQIIL